MSVVDVLMEYLASLKDGEKVSMSKIVDIYNRDVLLNSPMIFYKEGHLGKCCLTCEHCYDWDCARNSYCGIHGSLTKIDPKKYRCNAWTEKRKEKTNERRRVGDNRRTLDRTRSRRSKQTNAPEGAGRMQNKNVAHEEGKEKDERKTGGEGRSEAN